MISGNVGSIIFIIAKKNISNKNQPNNQKIIKNPLIKTKQNKRPINWDQVSHINKRTKNKIHEIKREEKKTLTEICWFKTKTEKKKRKIPKRKANRKFVKKALTENKDLH